VAVGLVAWGFEKEFSGQSGQSQYNPDWVKKAAKWFKNFLP
jgi:hypothetical protein